MRITRKIRPAADAPELVDGDTISSASIVRLGNITELVKGRAVSLQDGTSARQRRAN
jgi:hypothetical protein